MFYAVSGFLMQFIVPKGPMDCRQTGDFYASRAMRIYPLFFVASASAIGVPFELFLLGNRQPFLDFAVPGNASLTSIVTVILTNLTIFGQDVMRVLVYDAASGA